MSELISVFLTTQKRKLGLGQTFQLSAHQIQADSGKHDVDIQMNITDYKKLIQNVEKNKGFRFTADKIVGSGFFKDIAKTVGKTVAKKVADKGLDFIGSKTGQTGVTNALKGSVDGLVDVGVNRVSGGKLVRGSPEMKEKMARLRSMKKGKGMVDEIDGASIASDFRNFGRKVKRGFTKTFNPKLGREIKDAFTSKPAREVYKGLASFGLKAGSAFTGLPLGLAQGEINRQIDGASIRKRNNVMVTGGSLVHGVPQIQVRSGAGFHGKDGTHYGGSFRPSYGASMISP
jgi:hypothetical protein